MTLLSLWIVATLAIADPITPSGIRDALDAKPTGEASQALVARIVEAFPPGHDLKTGGHLIDGETVAFVIEAQGGQRAPRVGGDFVMLNRGRGYDMIPIGETGVFAIVATIPDDTKFAYKFDLGSRRKVGGGVVEMSAWRSPDEAREMPGRSYGKYVPLAFRSKVFDNNRTGWIYVPASYDPKTPAALMVFQDGDAYKGEHVGTVVDNLIADGTMPVTIVVGLNPGVNDDGRSNRSVEYDSLGGKYASFLDTEVIPLVKKDYAIRDEPDALAIGGASSGGICAFTVAWERPDLFGRVCSQIGSFTNIRGGHVYPKLVRDTPKKPIRVFLHDGSNDLINRAGDWWESNLAMFAALQDQGYDVEFLRDRSFHSYTSCGRVLPQALRATWAAKSKP